MKKLKYTSNLAYSPIRARHLVRLREKERQVHANYPLRGTIRTPQKIVRTNLQTEILKADLECPTNIGAHRNKPRIGGVEGPVVCDRRIALGVPTAIEVLADFGLEIRLIHTAAVAISGKGHEWVCQYAVEPSTLRIDECRRRSRGPAAASQFCAAGAGQLKYRPGAPNPGVRLGRRQEK